MFQNYSIGSQEINLREDIFAKEKRKMERATGIEPAWPAWEAGA